MKTYLSSAFLFSLIVLSNCSTPDPKKTVEDWQPEFDQVFTDSSGRITFARTHYIVPKKEEYVDLLETKTMAFMDKACQKRRSHILRKYNTESDFVTLRVNYRGNPQVKIYEFSCR